MKYFVSERTAAWLRKQQQRGAYDGDVAPTRRAGGMRGVVDDFPPPFTVRWSFSENEGAGAWCIWLPDLAKLFAYGGTYATLDGVTACTELPAGWYTVDDSSGGTDTGVYVVATISTATGAVESVFVSSAEQQASTGEEVVNIPVATMETDTGTGARRVRQLVDSAIHVGGGEGSSVVVSADGPFTPIYDEEDGETVTGLTNCYWMNGGKTILMSDQTIASGTTGFVCLRAGATPSTNGTADIQVYATFADLQAAQNAPGYFIVPLYVMSASKITLDLRNIPHVYTGEIY